MKSIIKNKIKKYSNLRIINFIFYQRKYQLLGFGLVLYNTLCQRIFKINGKVKWQVHFTSRVTSPEKIIIHDETDNSSVFLSFASSGSCYIQGNNGIEIHKNVIWSYGVNFISANHSFINYAMHARSSPIILRENVWIGANSVILPGIEIGKFSIVGAGSIVTKNVPSYSIIAGNPASIIGYRCKDCLDKVHETFRCISCEKTYSKEDYK